VDYANDIKSEINNITTFTKNMDFETFLRDIKTQHAVIRALEVIGEAVKKLPDEIKLKYPQVKWKEIGGTRDKLIHEYFGVNFKIVWKVRDEELGKILPVIEEIIKGAKE
jgi:uncharacterized protein with HEPN domain